MEVEGILTQFGERIRPDWNVIDWRAGDLSKLDTHVTASYETGQTPAWAPFSMSLINQPNVSGGSTPTNSWVPKMRITNTSGEGGGNTRRFIPITGSHCKNGEVKVLVLGKFRPSADQIGLCFRIGEDAASSNRPWAHVVWHEGTFQIESQWHMDWWRQGPTGSMHQGVTFGNLSSGLDMPGLQVWRNVLHGSKIGTLITLNIGAQHGVKATDKVTIQTEGLDEYALTVTGADQVRGTITCTSGTSPASPIFNVGSGRILCYTVMPFWVYGRCIDDQLQLKCWRMQDAEPDWGSVDNAERMMITTGAAGGPGQTPGRMGLVAAHITDATHFVDVLSVHWRSLD